MPSPNVNNDIYTQFLLCEWKKELAEKKVQSQKEKLKIDNHYRELLKDTLNSKQKKTNKQGFGLEQQMMVPSRDVLTSIDGVNSDNSLSDSSLMSNPIQTQKKIHFLYQRKDYAICNRKKEETSYH